MSRAAVPVAYVAEVEPETGWFTLLIEDIVGGRQGDQIEACTPATAAAVLEEMAGLHAPCWEAADLAALQWLNRATPESDALLGTLVGSLLPGFLERYEDDAGSRRIATYVSGSSSGCRPGCGCRSGPRTASHGDFRLDNLLFQPESAAPRGGGLADGGLGERVHRRGLLRRRMPERRGPPRPRAGPDGPLSRRALPARRAGVHPGAAARGRPARHLRRRRSWQSWRPWSCSAPSAAI